MTEPAGSDGRNRWAEVWAHRRLDPSKGSLMAQLLAADGFDTGLGDISYAGLEHVYFSREWFREALTSCRLHRVETADQGLAGYGNAPFRFNAWAFKPPPKD